MHKECAILAYATNGAYPFNVVYTMPVYIRKFHLRYISTLKEKEKEDVNSTNKKPPSKIHRPGVKPRK
jgi:hypothetical protein